MERRSFMVKAGALFSLPLIITEIGCDTYGDDDTMAPINDDGSSFSITSTSDSGHSHTVTLSSNNVDDPPSGDVSLKTTVNSGHTHTITLMQSDYESLAAGKTIIKTSTNDSGHSHTFSIKVP